MCLVRRKKSKKKYDKVFIYLYDGDVFEFDLQEWEVYREPDWVEVIKNDESEMNSYVIGNIIRVRFISITENKNISIVKDITQKSISPIVA
jgi:hypothetical protein